MNVATEFLSKKEVQQPRTILGFFAIVLGLVFAAVIALIAILAGNETSTYLIPWLAFFAGVLVLGVVVVVLVIALKDPSKLMLGQVTGSEFVQIQQTLLGDSNRGERMAVLQLPTITAIGPAEIAGDEPIEDEAEEEEEEEL